jgi:hypothetical protein
MKEYRHLNGGVFVDNRKVASSNSFYQRLILGQSKSSKSCLMNLFCANAALNTISGSSQLDLMEIDSWA